jgi:hypothetical protein
LIAQEERRFSEVLVCGGALVKILRCLLILIILGLSSSAVLADGIQDPGFGMGGGKHSIILNSPNDPAFMIDYVAGGTTPTATEPCGPPFTDDTCISSTLTDFTNNTHQTFTSVSFDITSHTAGLVFSCNNAGDPYFDTCNATNPITGDPVITFSGTTTHPGILPADSCTGTEIITCTGPTANDGTLLLYDFLVPVDVSDALVAGDAFHARGSATVPEPPSVLLVLAGGMLLFLFKRSQGISALRFGS